MVVVVVVVFVVVVVVIVAAVVVVVIVAVLVVVAIAMAAVAAVMAAVMVVAARGHRGAGCHSFVRTYLLAVRAGHGEKVDERAEKTNRDAAGALAHRPVKVDVVTMSLWLAEAGARAPRPLRSAGVIWCMRRS